MLMRLEAIWITQSGAPPSGASRSCFARMKIWSSESLISREEKRYAIV